MWQKIKNYYHLLQAALAAIFFNFPSNHIYVIGVTGTDGKTTTVHMIYEILKSSGQKVSMISSIYAAIGSKTYDTGFHVTMPTSWQIQKLLRRSVDAGHKYFILEATSHGLDQKRLAFTKVDLAVLTNITHEHLDYHKTWHNYAMAKIKLLKTARKAIINADDEKSFDFAVKKLKNKPITYGLNSTADFNLKNFNIKLKLLGLYNKSNALSSAAAASTLGISRQKIIKALAQFKGARGRMDKIDSRQNFDLYIDFAHTPNALKHALKTLKNLKDGKTAKLIAVFGAAGKRDRAKRPLMGKVADELADVIILTSEDPRAEDPEKIIGEISSGIKNKRLGINLFTITDRRQAINFAVNLASPGDVIACCGKGHEKSIAVKGKEIPWDEYEAARNAIRSRKDV